MENEQWKISGDCRICRRKEYCKKQCKLSKKKFEAEVCNLIVEKTGLGQIMDTLERWKTNS